MRLIDADALLKELRKSCEYHAENSREFSLLQRDIIIVQEQATIDAVPVIRCNDCIHCADDWNGNQPTFTCELGRAGESVQPNDYCSYAERRGEE